MAPRRLASRICDSMDLRASAPLTTSGGALAGIDAWNSANEPPMIRRAPAAIDASTRFLVPSVLSRLVGARSLARRGPCFGSAVS